MAAIDEHRVRYLTVALNHIDRHRSWYEDKEEQNHELAELIEKHQLKETLRYRGMKPRLVKLTASSYRSELGKVVKAHKNPTVKTKVDLSTLFQKGSSILDDKYLEKLDYQRPARKKNQDNDEDTDEDDQDDEQREEPEDAATAEAQNADGDSSATAANPTEIPDSIEESSQEVQASVEETQNAVAKKRVAPIVLSAAPRAKSVPETKKRKRDEADEDVPQPMVELVPQSSMIDITERRTTGLNEVAPQSETHASQTERPRETAGHSKAPSLESLSAATLPKLSNGDLIKQLSAIWADIQSITLNLEAEMNDRTAPGHFHLHPNAEPKLLFLRIFGDPDWEKRASELILNDVVNKVGFVEAIFSAAVYQHVFKSVLPWSHPKQILGALNDKQKYFDQVIGAATKATGLCMHTVLWQGAIMEAEDKNFHQQSVRPYAMDLARKFMMDVASLLKATWTREPAGLDAFWSKITEQVAMVFCKASIFKRQMEVAPDYYRWSWIGSGAALDDKLMEELHESRGEQEVVWTLTPLIEKRPTQDADWQVLCPARVLTRPRPEARLLFEG